MPLAPHADPDDSFHGIDLWCDLLCPDCNAVLDDINDLRARVPMRFRHFPLVSHIWAVPAAHVVEEARVQGVLWPVAGAILGAYDEIHGVEDLINVARMGGAEPVALRRALADGRHRTTVAGDYRDGRRNGVRGVPTLVVHGPGDPIRLDGGRTRTGLVDAALALVEARGLATT